MYEEWKEVKTRKACRCACCDDMILQGTICLGQTVWALGNPKSIHFCGNCGPQVKAGKSWEEARAVSSALREEPLGFLCAQLRFDPERFLGGSKS
jgi:hypothetical protein